MADGSTLRASDEEREHVARELREHFALGRLDADELAARLERVYAARTVGELAEQMADLPDLPRPPETKDAELVARRDELRRQLIQQTGGSLGLFGLCVGIWAVSGAGSFWPEWVLIAPAIFFGRNIWRLHGPAPELDRVEAELQRRRAARGRDRGARRAAAESREDLRLGETLRPSGPGGRVE
jgi:hypothetical protein